MKIFHKDLEKYSNPSLSEKYQEVVDKEKCEEAMLLEIKHIGEKIDLNFRQDIYDAYSKIVNQLENGGITVEEAYDSIHGVLTWSDTIADVKEMETNKMLYQRLEEFGKQIKAEASEISEDHPLKMELEDMVFQYEKLVEMVDDNKLPVSSACKSAESLQVDMQKRKRQYDIANK